MKKSADSKIGIDPFGMVCQRFPESDDGLARWDLCVVDRCMDEVRRRCRRTGERKQFRRGVYSGHFKTCVDERLRQRSGSASHLRHTMDSDSCIAEPAENLGCRATCKRSERSGLNVRKVLLVQ